MNRESKVRITKLVVNAYCFLSSCRDIVNNVLLSGAAHVASIFIALVWYSCVTSGEIYSLHLKRLCGALKSYLVCRRHYYWWIVCYKFSGQALSISNHPGSLLGSGDSGAADSAWIVSVLASSVAPCIAKHQRVFVLVHSESRQSHEGDTIENSF